MKVGAGRVPAVRHHGEILVDAGIAPHLEHVGAFLRERVADGHVIGVPGRPRAEVPVRILEPLVAECVQSGPDHAPVRHLDLVGILPDVGPVVVGVRHGADGVGREIDLHQVPVRRHVVPAARGHFVAADIADIHAEQRRVFLLEIGARFAVEILHARQVRPGHHVHAFWNDLGQEEIQHAVGVAGHRVVHAHVAGKNDGLVVRVRPRGEVFQVHEVRLVPKALQGARDLLHLAFVAVVLRIVRGGPQEGDVRLRLFRAGQEFVEVDAVHQVEREAGDPERRLDHAVRVQDAEPLFAIRDVGAVMPRENVRADRARFETFPQRVADERSLALLVHSRPHAFGTREARFRVKNGNPGHFLRVRDAPLAVLRFVAENGPGVVVDGEEIERRVRRRAGRRDLAAVLRVVPPILLAPLHADGGVRDQVVRIRRLRRLRAKRRVAGNRILAPLDHVGPLRTIHAIGPVLLHEGDVGEVRVPGAPGRIDVRDGPVFCLAPIAERLLAIRVVSIQESAPQTEVAVFIADDPRDDGLGVLVAGAYRAEELGVLRAGLRRFVPDDVRLPPRRVRNAQRVHLGRMHRVPVIRKPRGRPLVADQGENADVACLASLHQIVVVCPVPLIVPRLFDVLPHEVNTDGVGPHLLHLVEIIINLVVRLPNTERSIPRLVRDAVGHPGFCGSGVVKIPVPHLDEGLEGRVCARRVKCGQQRRDPNDFPCVHVSTPDFLFGRIEQDNQAMHTARCILDAIKS